MYRYRHMQSLGYKFYLRSILLTQITNFRAINKILNVRTTQSL